MDVTPEPVVLNHRAQDEQDAESRVAQKVNWSTISWLLEHAVFLLVGLQTKLIFQDAEASEWPWATILLVALATLATTVVLRILWTLGTVVVSRKLNRASVPGALVVGWAGMRGVVTLAAALTLPFDFPGREVLVFVALFVTVCTLLGQGLTLPTLARRLGTNGPDAREDAVEEVIVMHRASVRALNELRDTIHTDDEETAYAEIDRSNTQRLSSLWDRLDREGTESPEATQRQLNLEMLQTQRRAVLHFRESHDVEQAELHHAREHFESTGHPVLRSFTPGESWRHCLVHDVGTH